MSKQLYAMHNDNTCLFQHEPYPVFCIILRKVNFDRYIGQPVISIQALCKYKRVSYGLLISALWP